LPGVLTPGNKESNQNHKQMKSKSIILLSIILLPLLGLAQNSYATNDTLTIQEVVIKAAKIGSTLEKMPASVSILQKCNIQTQQINNLSELSARVPNLFMPEHGSRLTSSIYIRGIGARIGTPSVGLYVDNIPYFEKGSFNFAFYNVSKIEVLRGPQGTLYGRNTLGGLIKVYTDDPVSKQAFSLNTEYGNYNQLKSVLHYNQPLGNKFSITTDAVYYHNDGFFVNQYTTKTADKLNTYSGRVKLSYHPNSHFKMQLTAMYEKNDQLGYPYAIYDKENQTASDVNYNRESSYDRGLLSTGLYAEYTGKTFVLTSATGFQHLNDDQLIDQDFTPASLVFVEQSRNHNTVTQEFTIHSVENVKFSWVAGMFGFSQQADKNVRVDYGEDAVTVFHLPAVMSKYKSYNQPTRGIAGYGQIGIPFGNFMATAGARIDYEASGLTYSYDLEFNNNLIHKDDFDNNLHFSQFLPKFTLSYHPGKTINTYVSVAKGYKAGGFNSTFEADEGRTYNPESSLNYELGIKSTWFNRKLIANASLFYIDWKNQQVYQTVPSGQGAMIKNAGHSYSKGVELELRALPLNHWQVWLGAGYTEAKYIDYVRDSSRVYNDNYLPYVPNYTLNVGSNYAFQFNTGWLKQIVVNANYQYFGKIYWNDDNSAWQKAYGLLNGRVSFVTGNIDFGVWVKNILNTNYNAYYFSALGHDYVELGKPVQFGLFLNLKL